MEIERARRLVGACFDDPEIARLYEAGDHLSRSQTKHDIDHAYQVRDLAEKVVAEIESSEPGLFDEWTRDVVIPLAAFLHDIGRAINVEEHASAGAKWARGYFRRLAVEGEMLPDEVAKRICRIIACHRSRVVHKRDFDDPAWAIVVLADKCVGDEERVRRGRQIALSILTLFRASWIPMRKGGIHDRANFAIKRAELVFDASNMVLSVTMDRRVCKPSLIYKLYSERFKACDKAARYLGYGFRLEFNGERFRYSKEDAGWLPDGNGA